MSTRGWPTFVLALFSITTASAQTTPFDGHYRFADSRDYSVCRDDPVQGPNWSMSIQDGYVEFEDDRCRLTNSRYTDPRTVHYLGICTNEGEELRANITITKDGNEIQIDKAGDKSRWRRCLSVAKSQPAASIPSKPPTGRWRYSNGAASIFARGYGLQLTCRVFNPSSTYPEATLWGLCPGCFPGDKVDLVFSVDGRYGEKFEFEKRNNADGWVSPLYSYPVWYDDLIEDLISGRSLQVLEAGEELVNFSLKGSSKAIKRLRSACN